MQEEQGHSGKRSIRIKGRKPQPQAQMHMMPAPQFTPHVTRDPFAEEDWAFNGADEQRLGSMHGHSQAMRDALSNTLPTHPQPPQPSCNAPSAVKPSRKVKIKARQAGLAVRDVPQQHFETHTIPTHSSLPVSLAHDSLSRVYSSGSLPKPPAPTFAASTLPRSHSGKDVKSFAPSLPPSSTTSLPQPGHHSAPATFRGAEQPISCTSIVAPCAPRSPGSMGFEYNDIFSDLMGIGPLSPGKFDAAADPEPTKVTAEFIDEWFETPRLTDLLCSSPAAPSPLQGTGALIAELHQLVGDDAAPDGRKLASPSYDLAQQWSSAPGPGPGPGPGRGSEAHSTRPKAAGGCRVSLDTAPTARSGPARLGGIHDGGRGRGARAQNSIAQGLAGALRQCTQHAIAAAESDATLSDEGDGDDSRDSDWLAGGSPGNSGGTSALLASRRAPGAVAAQRQSVPFTEHSQGVGGRGRGVGRGRGGRGGRGRGRGRQSAADARAFAAAQQAQRVVDAEAAKQYEAEVHERFLVAKGYFQARKDACALAQVWQRAGQVRERAKQLKTILSAERRSRDVRYLSTCT